MATKKKDLLQSVCYTRAEDESPTFLLTGHDCVAPETILFWAMARKFARTDDLVSVGAAIEESKEFRTYYADYLRRNPDKIRKLPMDVTIWLNVFQQFMENLIGLNEKQANPDMKFNDETLKNCKRTMHRLYAEAMQMEQGR